MKYSIEDTTLTSIGDVLRKYHGETKTIITEGDSPMVVVSKTSNAIDHTQYNGSYENNAHIYDVVTIPGAVSIEINLAYQTEQDRDYLQIEPGIVTSIPSSTTKYTGGLLMQIPKLTFPNTDSVTFYFHSDTSGGYFLGYYAECIGYDINGNIVKEKIEHQIPNTYNPLDMAAAVDDIIPILEPIDITVNGTYTPREGVDGFNQVTVNMAGVPEEAFSMTGNLRYKFYNGMWDWFINTFGEQVTTYNISDLAYMFANSTVETIPFELNSTGVAASNNGEYIFANCTKLKKLPKINNFRPTSLQNIFHTCTSLEEVPEEFSENWDWSYIYTFANSYGNPRTRMFYDCRSLKRIASNFIKYFPPKVSVGYSPYQELFRGCYSLEEIRELGLTTTATWSTNAFKNTFYDCLRLKDLIFETQEDGTPLAKNWKTQTIDLAYCGWVRTRSGVVGTYPVFSTENEVTDDLTYQALKDSRDWWSSNVAYSRYNHDSAVTTINSLPDTSAYLATQTSGTNTITFKGEAGSLTDGGAINTLSEEEIAIAAAKGWTVAFA